MANAWMANARMANARICALPAKAPHRRSAHSVGPRARVVRGSAGSRAIGRFGKTLGRKRQGLVGAENKSARMRFSNESGLLTRQQSGDGGWVLQPRLRFEATFVNVGRT